MNFRNIHSHETHKSRKQYNKLELIIETESDRRESAVVIAKLNCDGWRKIESWTQGDVLHAVMVKVTEKVHSSEQLT